jgi:ribosome production factor 2
LDSKVFSRKNPDVKPFETGGEAPLEYFCNKSNCSLYVLGAHTKKRPHSISLGRLYDFHLYDSLELGVENYRQLRSFKGAATTQIGNKVS